MGVVDAPASSREHLQRRNQKPVPLSALTYRRFLPAADKGRVECLKLLLDASGDVNKSHNDGLSPISIASQVRQSAALSAWLLAGGNVSQVMTSGQNKGGNHPCCVFKNYPQAENDSTTYFMLASMMDEEAGKAVDSDGSTEGEEEVEERRSRKR